MPTARLAWIATLFLIPLMLGCSSSGGRRPQVTDQGSWALTAVELDSAKLGNAGVLPIFRKSDSVGFSRAPMASGSMQRSDSGLVSVRVEFRETVVGFSGQTVEHKYDVMSLVGKNDGDRIIGQGPIPADVRMGTVTEIEIDRDSDTRMRLRPMTRGTPLPYIFTFEATGAYERSVAVPIVE